MLPIWDGEIVDHCCGAGSSVTNSTGSLLASEDVGAATVATDSEAAEFYWLEEEDRLRQARDQFALHDEEGPSSSTWCEFLTADSSDLQHSGALRRGCADAAVVASSKQDVKPAESDKGVAAAAHRGSWPVNLSKGDCCCPHSQPPPPTPPPPSPPLSSSSSSQRHRPLHDAMTVAVAAELRTTAGSQANNSNRNNSRGGGAAAAAAKKPAAGAGGSGGGGILPAGSQAVASSRTLPEIEAAVEHTRNNSNQQQRYEMRGGHAVEICSRVDFPDKLTRDVFVTVEATHSNGCHRVVMLKGLTAKKRPDLGPKVKDCRLRMDQIVLTRANTGMENWQKNITMSYDSDFQVGLGGEERNRPL